MQCLGQMLLTNSHLLYKVKTTLFGCMRSDSPSLKVEKSEAAQLLVGQAQQEQGKKDDPDATQWQRGLYLENLSPDVSIMEAWLCTSRKVPSHLLDIDGEPLDPQDRAAPLLDLHVSAQQSAHDASVAQAECQGQQEEKQQQEQQEQQEPSHEAPSQEQTAVQQQQPALPGLPDERKELSDAQAPSATENSDGLHPAGVAAEEAKPVVSEHESSPEKVHKPAMPAANPVSSAGESANESAPDSATDRVQVVTLASRDTELQRCLKEFDGLHRVEVIAHATTFPSMQSHSAKFKEVSDRDELDRLIRSWKRMSKAARQMYQGLHAALSDLSRAKLAYQSSKKKAEERAAVLKQKEALAKVHAELKRAAAAASSSESLCPLQSLPSKCFSQITILVTGSHVPGDVVMDAPWIMREAPLTKSFKDKVGEQLVEFASKHVEEEEYQNNGKVSWPLVPKKGGLESAKLWAHFLSEQCSLSEVLGVWLDAGHLLRAVLSC